MSSKDTQQQSVVSNSSSNGTPSTPKKHQYTREYWKEEEEQILRAWADKAQCYELMHSKSHEIYNYRNTLFVIPVIIISATGLEDTVLEGFKLGANDFITKPFILPEFSIRVRRLLMN